ncbi:aldo/keto reductase, partial [Streptomyces sp. SID69]|nr:aldo/keto reductase [Streptomyces sp. SID69]
MHPGHADAPTPCPRSQWDSDRGYDAALRAFGTSLAGAGRIRAAGVSSFRPGRLSRLLEDAAPAPAAGRIELHPGLRRAG